MFSRSHEDYDYPTPGRKPRPWFEELDSQPSSSPSSTTHQQFATLHGGTAKINHLPLSPFKQAPFNTKEEHHHIMHDQPVEERACGFTKNSPMRFGQHGLQEETWTPPQQKPFGQMFGCTHGDSDYPTPGRKPRPWFDDLDSKSTSFRSSTSSKQAAMSGKSLQPQTIVLQPPAFYQAPESSDDGEAHTKSVDEQPVEGLAHAILKDSPHHGQHDEVWTPPQPQKPVGSMIGSQHKDCGYSTPEQKLHTSFNDLDSQSSSNNSLTNLQQAVVIHSTAAKLLTISPQPPALLQQNPGSPSQRASASTGNSEDRNEVASNNHMSTNSTATQTEGKLGTWTIDCLKQVLTRGGVFKIVLEYMFLIGMIWFMASNVQEGVARPPAFSPVMAEAFINFHKCHDWIEESWIVRKLSPSCNNVDKKIISQEVAVEIPPLCSS